MDPRVRRHVGRTLAGLGLALVFLGSLFASALIHLGLPGPRRVAAHLTSRLLTREFKGRAEIGSVDKLGPGRLVASELRMRDERGGEVIHVRTLEASFNAWSIARSILTSTGKIDIVIDHVRLDEASTLIVQGPSGAPTIAEAFEPRVAAPEPAPEAEPSRLRVWLPRIEIGKLDARGKLGQAPTLEASVREARASLLVAPLGVAIDVERFGMVLRGLSGIDVNGIGSFHLRSKGAIWAYFDGDVGEVPAHAFARLDGKKLEARADLPRVDPAAARALLPSWPVHSPIALMARASGDLPHLDAEVTANLAEGTLHARGPVSVADGIDVDIDVDTQDLDLAAVNPSLPSTKLSARSALELWTDGQMLTLEANGAVEPSLIGGVQVPAIDLRAGYDERGLEARATFHEEGVPARLTVRMPPSGEVVVEAGIKKTRLENSPRLSKLIGARGIVEADVAATLKNGVVDGKLSVESSGLSYDGLSVSSAKLNMTARGPTATPERLTVNAQLDSKGVRLGPLPLEKLGVHVTGPLATPHVQASGVQEDGTTLDAEGNLSASPWTVQGAKFAVARRGAEISGALTRASFAGDQVEVQGLVVESGGKLTLDAKISPRHATLAAHGNGLDLNRVARALALPMTRLSGAVDIDADLELGASSRGKATVHFEDASLWALSGVDLDATASFDGKHALGEAHGGIEGMGSLNAAWNVDLVGNALSGKSWLDSTGQSQLSLEQLNLELLARRFGERFGIQKAGGRGYVRVSLARSKDTELPHALFVAGTEGLTLSVAGENGKPVEVNSLDVSLAGALNGATSTAEVSGRLFDFRGDIVTLSAEMPANLKLLVPALMRGGAEGLTNELREQTFRAVALVPERTIEQLPTFLRPEGMSGRVSGRAVAFGTFESPQVNLAVTAKTLMGEALGIALPIGVEASVGYVKQTGKLVGSVQLRQSRQRVAWGTFDLLLPYEHLIQPPKEHTPLWTGNAQLLLDGAPMGVLAALAERKVSGNVQGSLNVSRTEWMPQLKADLTLRHLDIDDTEVGEGRIVAESSEIDIIARTHFEDEYGSLTGSLQTRLVPSPVFVTLAPDSPIYVTLESEKYDAVVISPFVRSILPELSGSLDGSVRATLSPAPESRSKKASPSPEQEAEPWKASFEGRIRLSNGIVEPAGLGLRLLDTNISIEAKREGDLNVVYLNDIEGRAQSEQPNVHGNGTLWFENLELVRGKFEIEQRKTPFSAGGTQLAELTGKANATLELDRKANQVNVDVNIPSMLATLPERSEHPMIELAPNPDVTIQQPLGPPQEVESRGEVKTPYNIHIKLGDVRVTSRMMNLRLRGEPEVRLAEQTEMSGAVDLVPGGSIQVMGRTFFIEQGRVQFSSADPGNPHLDVSATWRAPNGVVVRAIVRGTANKPELSWDSDPALAGGEQAIVGLVLGSGDSSGPGSGAGLAGGAAVVNELFGRTGVPIEVYASRETGLGTGQVASLSERTWDSYTAAYRISDKVWFEGSFRQESTTFDTEQRSGFSGAIDWRFRPSWSLRTEVGTLGGGIDLLWRYSY